MCIYVYISQVCFIFYIHQFTRVQYVLDTFFYLYKFAYVSYIYTAQEWTNRTLAVHERVDSLFLVLPGSKSTITEITEYIYFSP